MKLEAVMKAMEIMKKGTFTHFEYVSELPVKAEYKNNIKIYKHTTMTARFCINYSSIRKVIERRNNNLQNTKPLNKNFNWVIKHAISYNTNTQNTSLHVYPFANSYPKNVYMIYTPADCLVVDSDVFERNYAEYVIPSYFKKTGKNDVFQVNIKNVIRIGGVKYRTNNVC